MFAIKFTGAIWQKPARYRAQAVRRVCEALEDSYGTSRLGNPHDPLDDLVYIIISNRTAPRVAGRTYQRLKVEFGDWEQLMEARPKDLVLILEPAGLSNKKSRYLREALVRIWSDFGQYSLDPLRNMPAPDAEAYLLTLPGVSDKVARCVMMYTLDVDTLPVDAHVHRIAQRLGWVDRKRADQCHDEMEALVPPHRRYAFHVGSIQHGRAICRPSNPLCGDCPISRYCAYYQGNQA